MNIGIFQFSINKNIDVNFAKIKNCIIEAKSKNVDLLLFHECALTGYPPTEIASIEDINFIRVNEILDELKCICNDIKINIIVGTALKISNIIHNSLCFIKDDNSEVEYYHKRALWGWDADNFTEGDLIGVFNIKDFRFGVRICFEVRFPEYFRELYKQRVDFCFISFCDNQEKENVGRYNLIMSHIVTRAVENCFPILTANSITNFQTAPSCVVDSDGSIVSELRKNKEDLLIYNFEKTEMNFGRLGRETFSRKLTTAST